MSYTLADFREALAGDSTRFVARFAESKWGNEEGDAFDPEYDEELTYLLTSEEVSLDIDGIGRVEMVIRWGGQGDGAATGDVVKVTNDEGERFFERTGTYSSWDSTYYGDWHEVEPYEKTVVRYRLV
jgi:hypothetical protein